MRIGKEVVGEGFIDREKELRKIRGLIQKSNIVIYGPRRIGKSSLMLEAARRLRRRYACVRIDVRRLIPLDHKNFIKHLGLAALEAYSDATGEKLLLFVERVKMELPELLSRIRVHIKDWVELSIAPSPDLTDFLKRTFEMGEQLSWKAKKDFILMIDELPGLVRLTKGRPDKKDLDFLWALRGHMNEAKHVHYIVSGSEVGMMERLCGSREAPFYGSLIPIKLGGLERRSSLKFLEMFIPSEFANVIVKETSCFPLYLQAYATAAKLDGKTLESLHTSVFELLHLHFSDLENHLSPQQRLILRTMASKNIRTTRETSKALEMPYTTIHSNLERAVLTGFLQKVGEGKYEFTDPLFPKWLALPLL
ncbi:MAG: ATP-binding protein [Euryarchaeota archaeon]|nr:ATP-binding protein [Euryarchaeota archaeon]